MKIKFLFAGLVVGGLVNQTVFSAEQVLASGPNKVQLIELFTSEGCSSCPPAEQRLTRLVESPDLWTKFVPVSFHVDYWDNLGWPDAFASSEFTNRQYAYANHWGNQSVYTPGFVLNGQEFRSGNFLEELSRSTGEATGRLQVRLSDKTVRVSYLSPDKTPHNLRLQVALLGCGLQSKVQRGENGGRTLQHDFIVLGLNTAPLIVSSDGLSYTAELALPERELTCRKALASWIEDTVTLQPVQSVGGWLDVK